MRTAISAACNWSSQRESLREHAFNHGSIAEIGKGWWARAFWRAAPLAVHLGEAKRANFRSSAR
eukprot:1336066-Pyramimonas_sp.AAC.1